MEFQSSIGIEQADLVFRTVRSGITATDTSAALQDGEPIIFATSTALLPVGAAVIRALTVTDVGNNRLFAGVVHDPRGSGIAHEGLGLAVVYGPHNVRMSEAATVAAFDRLVPDLNTTATALAPFGRGAFIARTITDTAIHFQSAAAVVALAPATAVSGTAGNPGSVLAFIRAL